MCIRDRNKKKPDPVIKSAADKTLKYLTNTLFNEKIGSFLSFQQADTSYYYLKKSRRDKVLKPPVIEKIFTDDLAITLSYLLKTLEIKGNKLLEDKILTSLHFLSEMIIKNETILHYYSIPEGEWRALSSPVNYALVVRLFQQAFEKYNFCLLYTSDAADE